MLGVLDHDDQIDVTKAMGLLELDKLTELDVMLRKTIVKKLTVYGFSDLARNGRRHLQPMINTRMRAGKFLVAMGDAVLLGAAWTAVSIRSEYGTDLATRNQCKCRAALLIGFYWPAPD